MDLQTWLGILDSGAEVTDDEEVRLMMQRPNPPCGARRIVRAYADPPILRPLQ